MDYDDDEYSCASVLHSHNQDVKVVVWHPDLPILASGSYDNNIKMFKEEDDDWVSFSSLQSHTNTVWDVAWDLNGERLASCSEDTSVRIWQGFGPGNKEGIQSRDGDPVWKCVRTLSGFHCRAIYSIDWGQAGLVTGGGDDTIRLWREVGEEWELGLTISDAHDMDVNCVTWNKKQPNLLASCSDDETVKIWKIEE